MGLDPQKFFIGLIDFFSILMPGAMLAYLCKDGVANWFGVGHSYPLDSSESAGVFLFASYLFGHLAFLVSAGLDEWVYDPVRCLTYRGQISRLVKGDGLSSRWACWLASALLFGPEPDSALQQVLRIKARALNTLGAAKAINAFQWSKVKLAKDLPAALVTVQRFEADSKFFRSFVIVLAVLAGYFLAGHFIWRGPQAAGWCCVAGMAPALWRYMEQRFKATQQAYWFVISLEAGAADAPPLRLARSDGLTHGGGVVYQNKDGRIQFLLVQSKDDRAVWVLPKGRIEAGEKPRETAVREVREETGQWGRVRCWIEDRAWTAGSGEIRVRWFLLEAEGEMEPLRDECRQSEWMDHAKAVERASFSETRLLLEAALRKIETLAR